ncbi:hypothetical protein CkaCkLH20_04973 [Colletotrichum karsti]|uniref:Wax synthase domain-containing protein n=1 Tax=Colletotrichum karsti TaxID=1095194 RepID=A0A9P6LL04_9PEZI|nr:uncharacterized protein CkaCkLH20_04973 [Colletotrichum karsti]KAF9877273.1 hypothetical protein CkaCkLH20_04973 [Colletotrichum karsti]
MLAINFADRLVVQPFAAYIDSGNFIEHYAPDQEILLRRVIFRDSSVFEPQVVSLRAVTAIWWVWNSVRALETGHAILAVISVCILRLDDPSDWPPLYGSPFEAYTVRRFWGKFWHNCMVPSAWEWASRVAQTLGLRKGSSSEKSFAAFGIFLVSGISHAVVAWKIREGEALRDVMFFVANYGIIVVERGLGRVIGLLWVYSWFFWMTPRWLYPKFYLWSLQIQHVEPVLA